MSVKTFGLLSLPVELLSEIQLCSLSESFPHTSHHFYDLFKHAPPFFNAQYILGRVLLSDNISLSEIYSRIIRYPICTLEVLEAAHQLVKNLDVSKSKSLVRLPMRLFRTLKPPLSGWTSEDDPIPFLQYLCNSPDIPFVDVNYPKGYMLTRAVYAKFFPLVEFLLDHLALPGRHGCVALKVAVCQKDLRMFRLLVERRKGKGRNKKPRSEDRVLLDNELLKIAVVAGATDIIEYLLQEKGVTPDIQTLKKLKL